MRGTKKERLLAKIRISPRGCWEWTASFDSGGYGVIKVGGENKKAHRVSYEIFNGSIPEKMCVCHKCDNPKCINPDHLFIGTQQANIADRQNKCRSNGGSLQGEKNKSAKLTNMQVAEIKRAIADGCPQKDLAIKYSVSATTIWAIKHGLKWSCINAC